MLPREVEMPEPAARLPEPASVPLPASRPDIPAMERFALRAALPPALAAGPDAPALLRALRRRWLVALVLGVLAAGGAGAAVWFLLPASYTVFAQLQVAANQEYLSSLRTADNTHGRSDFGPYLKTQMDRIRSRYVLTAALKRDEVKRLGIIRDQPDPIMFLEDELKVQSQEGSELLNVIMNGPDPTELVPLVNAITQAYLQEIDGVERRRRTGRVAELEAIYTELSERLRKMRERRQKLADELNTSDTQALTQKQLILLGTFGEMRKLHAQTRIEVMRAQNRFETHKAQEKLVDGMPLPDATLNEVIDGDPLIRQYLAQIARWDELMADYKRRTPNPEAEPSYREARARRAEVQKQLDARREELRTDLAKRFRQKARADYEVTLIQLQNEIGPLLKQEQALLEEVQRLGQEVDRIGKRSTELEALVGDIQRDEKTTTKVAEELEALKVELRSPLRVSLFQEAAVQRKDRKRQLMALIFAPVLALLGVCLAVAWWDFRGRRIHTADEVYTGLGMRVVGAVPVLPTNAPMPLLTGPSEDGSDHHLLESIDGIRTLLLRDANVEATRVLMVTSAVSGEGKTTLATHLAGSLARAGRRTLLLDCDLRRPSIHQLFELPPQPGLSEVLLGEVHLAEATLATPVPGLWVIPAGQWDRHVMQALAKDGAREIFEKLKSEYDFIVVDSHPVLPATDSLLIGQHVDAVILAVLRDVSQTPKVYAACQRLTSLGIRVLGAVVNGTQQDVYGNAYDYGTPAQAS